MNKQETVEMMMVFIDLYQDKQIPEDFLQQQLLIILNDYERDIKES